MEMHHEQKDTKKDASLSEMMQNNSNEMSNT